MVLIDRIWVCLLLKLMLLPLCRFIFRAGACGSGAPERPCRASHRAQAHSHIQGCVTLRGAWWQPPAVCPPAS